MIFLIFNHRYNIYTDKIIKKNMKKQLGFTQILKLSIKSWSDCVINQKLV